MIDEVIILVGIVNNCIYEKVGIGCLGVVLIGIVIFVINEFGIFVEGYYGRSFVVYFLRVVFVEIDKIIYFFVVVI